jgi:hypothetical protein
MKTHGSDKMSAGQSSFEGASYASPLPLLWRFAGLRAMAPNAGANPSNLNGLKSALVRLLKTQGRNKKGSKMQIVLVMLMKTKEQKKCSCYVHEYKEIKAFLP